MEGSLAALFKLQEADSLLDRQKAELAGIPGELALVESELASAKDEFSAFEKKLAETAASQKKCDGEKAEARLKMAEYKTKLLSLKTNAEYKAMLEQISYVERRIDDLDSRTLELMYEEDGVRKDMEEASKKLDRYGERARRKRELLAGREASLMSEVNELASKRADLSAAVPIRLLRKYEQLRSAGKACAVVGLVRGACGGCHTYIPPQNAVEISQGISYSCPICGRYIVDLGGNLFAGSSVGTN